MINLEAPGHIYSRISNPTVAVLEERLAALEGRRLLAFESKVLSGARRAVADEGEKKSAKLHERV